MLTKEECEKALFILNDLGEYEDGAPVLLETEQPEEYAVIKQLIKEHFDNPPLKFEELHEGMWVWDNVYEMYLKIEDIREDIIYPYEDYFCDPCDVSHNMWFDFEENRFYRKEVKQV